jgi:hypothetical protein
MRYGVDRITIKQPKPFGSFAPIVDQQVTPNYIARFDRHSYSETDIAIIQGARRQPTEG